MGSFLYALDLAGTFVFALSGATAGVKRGLDLFGVLVLSFVAANTGGILRDLVIGTVPPGAVSDWHYLGVSLAAGVVTFCFPSVVLQRWNPILLFDAAGLALFAVSGAHKALAHGLHPVMATLLGMLTGIGGGMARDVLLAEIPVVLRADLYAVAALVGAATVVVASGVRVPFGVAAPVGAALCFGLRVLAIKYGWKLPVARVEKGGSKDAE
jgi:uncharacterized membrane protein YeiH